MVNVLLTFQPRWRLLLTFYCVAAARSRPLPVKVQRLPDLQEAGRTLQPGRRGF